jgi:hypothetical protein
MASINIYLRENLAAVSKKNMTVAPEIPEKKLNNAVAAFGYTGSVANVVGLFDNTLFGSGKDGLFFTGEQMIYRASFSDPVSIPFANMASAEYAELLSGKNNEKSEPCVRIRRKDGVDVELKALMDCDYKKLASLLQGAVSGFDEFKEEKQIVPIEDMGEDLKVAYVKVLVNMAYDNDGVIDAKEMAEILLLMTRIDLQPASRMHLRSYIADKAGWESMADLVGIIDSHCPEGQIKSVHISLVKDLINTYLSTDGGEVKEFGFFNRHRALLQVSDAEIDLAVQAIMLDRQLLNEDVNDDQIVATLKTLSAKAAAVGTPLAAVYLSGSVIGLSAAGMTSGLATLGMGGMLGMSSMATGIGVAVLIGVGTYAGVRKLTGVDELTRFKRRELMLHEVLKLTQTTIGMLVEDINFITVSLNEALVAQGVQDEKIRRLAAVLKQLSGAGAVLTGRSEGVQASSAKLKCAGHLDETKLKSLTREATKAELFGHIRAVYEERVLEEEKDGQKHSVTRLVLKPGRSNKELEELARAFEAVGYFKVGDVLKGAASDVADKAKEKLAGLFS